LITRPPRLALAEAFGASSDTAAADLPKPIWRAPNISTSGLRDLSAPWLKWIFARQRFTHDSAALQTHGYISGGGAASKDKVWQILQRAVSWTRATFLLCNRSRSVTKHWR